MRSGLSVAWRNRSARNKGRTCLQDQDDHCQVYFQPTLSSEPTLSSPPSSSRMMARSKTYPKNCQVRNTRIVGSFCSKSSRTSPLHRHHHNWPPTHKRNNHCPDDLFRDTYLCQALWTVLGQAGSTSRFRSPANTRRLCRRQRNHQHNSSPTAWRSNRCRVCHSRGTWTRQAGCPLRRSRDRGDVLPSIDACLLSNWMC